MKHVTDSTVLPGAQVAGGGPDPAAQVADVDATQRQAGLEGADQAVVDLLGLIAYGELTAFERLATDARMAPTLTDKIALAAMAAAEFAHFEAISRALAGRGIDPEAAMAPFIGPLTAFHGGTAPADWLESLVKAYVGDSIAADFYRAIAHRLDDDARALVLDVLADTGHAAFVVDRVRAAIVANPVVAGRLALWARRLVGEALNQAKQVAVERDALTGLLVGVGDLEAVAAIFDSIMKAHTDRMAALGLSA
ncbi:ferritin-like fold-containing protein [Pseudofrankia inefficax]|uniref:ferritin-like fold-containing protein n=1 Tax=Pseudofrankia inefficax (strain DSM 45817 / CECT 9037 / DDB 130130 / EuI1c) TaxID=298654 RepID=UPI003F648F6B